MICEFCKKELEDHLYTDARPGISFTTPCTRCNKTLREHQVTCGNCGGKFCGDHIFQHNCPTTAPPARTVVAKHEPGMAMYMSLIIVAGIVVVLFGMWLASGNRSGLFPTFPFAGFLTMTGGFALIGYGARGEF